MASQRSHLILATWLGAVLTFAAAPLHAGTYADLVKSHAPIAYWRMEETPGTAAADEMLTYPGTYSGPTLNQTSFGKADHKAALFDGVNDSINVGAPNVGGSELTVAAWVKGNAFGASGTRIFAKKKVWTMLFVVTSTTAMTYGESIRYGAIGGAGFEWRVNLIAQSATQAAFNSAVALADMVYISEQVDPTQVNTKLKAALIGVVNEEIGLANDFGFATSTNGTSKSVISVQTNAHYITQPFPMGDVQITYTNQPFAYLDSGYAGGLNQLAQVNTNGIHYRPILTTLNAGGALAGGGTAAGRRVQLPWGGAGFDITQLTPSGQLIAIRAFQWAAGRTDATAETNRHYWTLGTATSSGNAYPQFILKAGGTTTTLTASTGALAIGEWAFLTAVYDGSTMRIFKNGTQIASVNKTGALDNGVNVPAWIGDHPEYAAGTSSARPFNGLIDEVAIFGKALTPAEINGLYWRGASTGVIIKSWTETQ